MITTGSLAGTRPADTINYFEAMRNIRLFFTICIFASCTRYSPEVEEALQRAGSNREQLEQVLKRYGCNPADSLKLRAAEFLIANMVYHHAVHSDSLAAYFNALTYANRQQAHEKSRDILRRRYDSIYVRYEKDLSAITFKADVEHLTSDYLAKNIEQACERWQNRNWSKHLSFDEFCEYLLPYRVDDEPVEEWRENLEQQYRSKIEWIKTRDNWRHSTYHACLYLNNQLTQKGFHVSSITPYPYGYPPSFLNGIISGTCDNYAVAATYIMRSCGIPVAIDYVPQWPYRSTNHVWNVVLSSGGKWIPFMGGESGPDKVVNPGTQKGKVFRKTFSYQKSSLYHQNRKYGEDLPATLSSPCIADVSEEYFAPVDVALRLTEKPKRHTRFAYLSVFDNKSWIPVQWTRLESREKAVFKKMEHGIAYMPVYYFGGEIQAAADPFILTIDNEVKTLTPDTLHRLRLTLTRKYPRFNGILGYSERMVGGYFEASNHPEFKDASQTPKIERNPNMSSDSMVITEYIAKPYRYWRFVTDKSRMCNVAELQFLTGEKCINHLGAAIGVECSHPDKDVEKAFDGKAVTYFESRQTGSAWVGMDFKQPVRVECIKYLPRNDDNNVWKGDRYELFYWHRRWVSLGVQLAQSDRLTYDNVPQNALLLLHNHTKGTEERIFTVENGEQVWW
jgi:hypothetical protein